MRDDFITDYIAYQSDTEPPVFFHRWACISMLGAYLGRDMGLELGSFEIFPNMYAMLIGVPGTRKSTAIKLSKMLLKRTGYAKFSADKSSKEKFILDLSEAGLGADSGDLLDSQLFGGDSDDGRSSEVYIACDEFNNFIGNGNIEFVSLLGEFWDYSGTYTNRIKNGKSVSIVNPTVSILGGNTATGFSLAFPTSTIGQGFFSRLLLIYSEPSARKITFPEKPSEEHTQRMVDKLLAIKSVCSGNSATISDSAKHLLDKIYKAGSPIDDVRFEHYANRRFTHLLKIAIVCAASRCSTEIDVTDVVYANTLLHHTEQLMPKALGEFGQSKYSEVNHKIISLLEANWRPLGVHEIWKQLGQDMDKMNDLATILFSLAGADKIIRTEAGFLAKRMHIEAQYTDVLDYDYLSSEEAGPQPDVVHSTSSKLLKVIK